MFTLEALEDGEYSILKTKGRESVRLCVACSYAHALTILEALEQAELWKCGKPVGALDKPRQRRK